MIRFISLTVVSSLCFAQFNIAQQAEPENDSDHDQLEIVIDEEENSVAENLNDVKLKRLDTHLEVGTSFTFSPNNFYGPSIYVAPSLSYLVTPRFSFSVGVAVERSNYYFIQSETSYSDGMLPMTRAFLYSKGSYLLSPKLVLSGTVYTTMNDVPGSKDNSHPYMTNYNYRGMSLGLDYKINSSFSIGFHVATQNGYYPSNSMIPPAGYVYIPGF
jgi:hypothetical protein